MRKQRESLPRYPLRCPSLIFLINRSRPAPLLLTLRVKSGSIQKADWTNARPPWSRGSDVRLFHPAFENFSRQFLRTEELVNEEGAAHKFLVYYSADHYDSEKSRRDAVISILETLARRKLGILGILIGHRVFHRKIPWNERDQA